MALHLCFHIANIVIAYGTATNEIIIPSIIPDGIPITESLIACFFTIFFICEGDVPIVF